MIVEVHVLLPNVQREILEQDTDTNIATHEDQTVQHKKKKQKSAQ